MLCGTTALPQRLTGPGIGRLFPYRQIKGIKPMRITLTAAAAALFISVSAQAASTNIPAQQSTITYSTKSGVTSGFGNYARATSTVVYDPVTNTYTIRDTGSLTTKSSFGPAGTSSGNFTTYSASPTETFRVFNQSAIGLTYVDFGEWRRTSTSNGTTSVNDTYLIWGAKTTRGDLPVSGSATYSTIYDGNFVDKNGEHALSGDGRSYRRFRRRHAELFRDDQRRSGRVADLRREWRNQFSDRGLHDERQHEWLHAQSIRQLLRPECRGSRRIVPTIFRQDRERTRRLRRKLIRLRRLRPKSLRPLRTLPRS